MSLKTLRDREKLRTNLNSAQKILFSSPTLVLVTEKLYFFVNQCNHGDNGLVNPESPVVRTKFK
jgi:hypothetical protein